MPRAFEPNRRVGPAAATGSLMPLTLFGGALTALYAAAVLISASLPGLSAARAVAYALSLDLTVLVTALYYLLVVRRLRWPLPSVAAVFVLSLLAADALIPAAYGGLLVWLGYLAGPLELLLLGYIARRAYLSTRAFKSSAQTELSVGGDLLARLREAALKSFSPPLAAELLASELAVFCYAFSRALAADPQPDERRFSYHRECNYGPLLAAVLVLLGFEMLAVHFLVATLWSHVAAWVLTALSAYAALWLIADYKACLLRPIELAERSLKLRLGLRWTAELPYEQLADYCARKPSSDTTSPLSLCLFGDANFWLKLNGPGLARGPYGYTRRIESITLGLDEPARFAAMLRQRVESLPAAEQRAGLT